MDESNQWLGPKAYRQRNGELEGLFVRKDSGGLCEWRRVKRRDELPPESETHD